MVDTIASNGADADSVLQGVREVLEDHPVSFAMVFGSAARGTTTEGSDLDIAVELEAVRPGDAGYSDVYLRVYSDVSDALPAEVDVIDVHTMTPEFASVAFEDGVVVVGSASRGAELERELAGNEPSVEDARKRVETAVRRCGTGPECALVHWS